jgi:hypothetical protein
LRISHIRYCEKGGCLARVAIVKGHYFDQSNGLEPRVALTADTLGNLGCRGDGGWNDVV